MKLKIAAVVALSLGALTACGSEIDSPVSTPSQPAASAETSVGTVVAEPAPATSAKISPLIGLPAPDHQPYPGGGVPVVGRDADATEPDGTSGPLWVLEGDVAVPVDSSINVREATFVRAKNAWLVQGVIEASGLEGERPTWRRYTPDRSAFTEITEEQYKADAYPALEAEDALDGRQVRGTAINVPGTAQIFIADSSPRTVVIESQESRDLFAFDRATGALVGGVTAAELEAAGCDYQGGRLALETDDTAVVGCGHRGQSSWVRVVLTA